MSAAAPTPPSLRPQLWRLPLVLLVVVGVACARYLDQIFYHNFRGDAAAQAQRADALLENFLSLRASLVHGMQTVVATSASPAEVASRFGTLAREVHAAAPDVGALYLLDSVGTVRELYPDSAPSLAPRRGARFALPSGRDQRSGGVVGSLRFPDGRRGLLVYERLVPAPAASRTPGYVAGGYVAAAFAYRPLFAGTLRQQIEGPFAYRVRDETGEQVAASSEFAAREPTAELIRRDVQLPDGRVWTLDVAVPRFEPIGARLILWGIGALLLLFTVLLVLREEERGERLARHSLDLERLSRHLLDANVRLEERAHQVALANQAKSRFLANVSHELRTPLNAIVGYNALVLDELYGPLPPAARGAHQRIHLAADHLLGLVNDVLDLSKIEVGRMEVAPEEVKVQSVVESVLAVIEPIADAKGVRVDSVVPRELGSVRTDPRHLRQILLNLAGNAVKFTERGSVTIAARANERTLELAVEDTGVGIATEDHERIFDEFEQVRPGGRGDSLQRGTGLGLAISRKLARLLGGDVTVASVAGGGSRFTLALPLAFPLAPADGSASSARP